MECPYHLVDVFTSTPLEGNALAVFTDATGLDARTMQRIARELNLSETTFILPKESSEAATRVRIFTPAYEMEFAGHPTIGTVSVMRSIGFVPSDSQTIVLDENVGRVSVRVDDGEDLLWLTTPPIREIAQYPRGACATALSLEERDLIPDVPCMLLSAGNPNLFVPVLDRETVDRAWVNEPAFAQLVSDQPEPTCLFVFTPTERGAYSRMFGPEFGIVEDPATGSATGPLAKYMMQHGLASRGDGTRFISEQGVKMGRRSILHVLIHGENGADAIEIGGTVTPIGSGSIRLDPK